MRNRRSPSSGTQAVAVPPASQLRAAQADAAAGPVRTRAVWNALDRFAKSLPALSDDSLIDAYHQAWEDHRDARAEDSDNIDKAGAESLATETAMRARFHDYRTRYNQRYP
jgi:hypothetical protein